MGSHFPPRVPIVPPPIQGIDERQHHLTRLSQQMKDLQAVLDRRRNVVRRVETTRTIAEFENDRDDPYSRYLANRECGFVPHPEEIQSATVFIFGKLTGMAALIAESLCRCGLGRLIFVDPEGSDVSDSDLFFPPDSIGFPRATQAQEILHLINPDPEILILPSIQQLETTLSSAPPGPKGQRRIVVGLSMLDAGRPRPPTELHELSLKLTIPIIHLYKSGMTGSLWTVPPCRDCHAALRVLPPEDAANTTVEAPTELVLAGLGSHQVFKTVLGIGSKSVWIHYDGLLDTIQQNRDEHLCGK